MSNGANNPNVMPCSNCGGRGHIEDPWGNRRCPTCGGNGWISLQRYQQLVEKEKVRKKRDKYTISRLGQFLIKNPFEVILILFQSKKSKITNFHYLSLVWWGIFLSNLLILPAFVSFEITFIFNIFIVGIIFLYFAFEARNMVR